MIRVAHAMRRDNECEDRIGPKFRSEEACRHESEGTHSATSLAMETEIKSPLTIAEDERLMRRFH